MSEMQGPCVVCGHDPACGFASVNGDWYCHGDCPHEEDSGVSCYERRALSSMQQFSTERRVTLTQSAPFFTGGAR